jgi:hypothetical protein
MPYFKCARCRIRGVGPREQAAVAAKCPVCGETFEPIGGLIHRIDARLPEMERGQWTPR